jgi:hypothetical protein
MEKNFNGIEALTRNQCDFIQKYDLKIVSKDANVEGRITKNEQEKRTPAKNRVGH